MKIVSTFTRIALFSVMALFTAIACQGPRGPQGPTGQDGRDGRDGQDGNANVISINYFVGEENWYEVGTPGETDFFLAADLDVPEINQDIYDNGLVLVYYRANDNEPWIALPYTFISHDPAYIEKLDMIYNLSFVGLQSQATDKGASAWTGVFRVVVAEAVPVGKTEINYNDYDTANALLNIEGAHQIHRMPKAIIGQGQQK